MFLMMGMLVYMEMPCPNIDKNTKRVDSYQPLTIVENIIYPRISKFMVSVKLFKFFIV